MNQPATISSERWRLRASDFELLFEGGALEKVRRAELIDGDIYGMSPQTMRHARVKTELAFAMMRRLAAIGSSLKVVIEVSVIVADDSVPEPDIVVSGYGGDRFMPADTVALVVEVASSTLATDLGRKAELYAAAGVPEYWVVDVDGEHVVIHTQPKTDGYSLREEAPFGQPLTARTVSELQVLIDPLLD